LVKFGGAVKWQTNNTVKNCQSSLGQTLNHPELECEIELRGDMFVVQKKLPLCQYRRGPSGSFIEMSFGTMKINGLRKQCFGADHASFSLFSTARFYRQLCWLFFYSIPSALYDKTTHHFTVICLNDPSKSGA
jgi:hypothetical protein